MDNRAVGVFDSGMGGLTATQELSELMPGEHIIYLADSNNFPYGEKSREKIIDMSRKDLKYLLEKDVKSVFIACGTATSNALETLKKESPVPVFGVVEAAVYEALAATENGRIGLLATTASIRAGTYEKLLKELAPDIMLIPKACPKFASMVEDGIFDREDERVWTAVKEYLPPLKQAGVDTVILGCTHYPLLADVISEYMGVNVRFISAGAAAARVLCTYLRENGMASDKRTADTEYFTTGSTSAFAETARLMLQRDISLSLHGVEPFDNVGNI